MTIKSYPWSTTPVFVAEWSKMARIWRQDGVIGGVADGLEVYADATGMLVKVKAGDAYLKGHYMTNDAEIMLVVPAADAANPRIDRVVMRVDWSSEEIVIAVVQGTPAVAPVPPSLQDTDTVFEQALAKVNVAAGVVTMQPAAVVDERTFSPEGGGDVVVELWNHSGATVLAGDVLILDPNIDNGFSTSSSLNDLRAFAVAKENIANGSLGEIACVPGQVAVVNCTTGAVRRGEWLVQSDTLGKAQGAGFWKPRAAFAIALTEKAAGAAGQVSALLVQSFQIAIPGTASYSLGGIAAGAPISDAQKMTFSTGVWTGVPSAALGIARAFPIGGSLIGVRGYILGGGDGTGVGATKVANGDKVDYSTEVRTAAASLIAAQGWTGSNASSDLKMYLIGGYDNSGTATKSFTKFDFSNEVSVTGLALPTIRARVASASDGVLIFTCGAYTTTSLSDLLKITCATDAIVVNTAGQNAAADTFGPMAFRASAGYFGGFTNSCKIPFATGVNAVTNHSEGGFSHQPLGVSDGVKVGFVAAGSVSYQFDPTTETYTVSPYQLTPNKDRTGTINAGDY